MPVNVVHNAKQERHWSEAKDAYAKAKGKRKKNKWAFIMGTYKKIEQNASK